ncbi:hypothetical protein BZG35_17025 [Brevundimonas sp. LM2]|uniref:YdcF family protein n=1 Tax=Brevundimonas sp. LM2 TaxID=1938605 RepID=UPI0009839E64|nr:YdcF family protein [Brevundimonas sp. LM2]AQR63160.1 hypothetical protein BZG35_17025 [Brevundimonas sp. LM2]
MALRSRRAATAALVFGTALGLLTMSGAAASQDAGQPTPNAAGAARDADVDLAYRPLAGPSPLQDLNFYLLTLFEQSPEALAALSADADLEAIRNAAAGRARTAAAACEAVLEAAAENRVFEGPAACAPEALRWTDDERARAAAAVGRVYDRTPAVRRLVDAHMRPSGRFHRDAALDDRALLVRAWTEAQSSIDRIIRVYALGEAPRYADIDSVIYPVDGRYYQGLLGQLIREVARRADQPGPAYDLSRAFALELMDANLRDDAVRQSDLQDRENAATMARLAGVRWSDFPYAAILVPGYSPEVAYEPLNPAARIRLRRGVEHYRAGRAPVIIVSGGTLRPIGTPFNEALQMKRFLISHHGIPGDAILIDPVARHTTSNMRNAARLIFSMGSPRGMKALVSGQVTYIASAIFAARCVNDYGYVPFVLGRRLDFDTYEFAPVLTSLHREATDPMDP